MEDDDFNFDDVGAELRFEGEDAKLEPPNDAAQHMPLKLDLTEDRVDWKKLKEEDEELAQQIATTKGWNMDRFWDPEWCAACSLQPGPGQMQIERKVFENCEQAVAKNYEKAKMEEVCKAVRDIWVQAQLARMAPGERPATANVKFWSCRQVYEHLHDHNFNEYTRLVQEGRMYDKLARELYSLRKRVDALTGQELIDYKAVRELRAVRKENRVIQQEKNKASQRAERRFFLNNV